MAQEQGRAQELAALREALLRHQDELNSAIADSRSMRLARVLRRRRLSWLAAPLACPVVVQLALLPRRPGVRASKAEAVGRYRRLSGKDRPTAEAEVDRLLRQLFPLDRPAEWLSPERPAVARASRAELEAATEALLAWYLAGRRTDDALLREVLGVWDAYEGLEAEAFEQMAQGKRRRGGRTARRNRKAGEALREQFYAGWRRWLDQRATGASPPGPSG